MAAGGKLPVFEEFVAAENGDESDFSWFRDPERKTFNGLLSVLVRAEPGTKGEIAVVLAANAANGKTSNMANSFMMNILS